MINSMRSQEIRIILDKVENFILIKQQNSLIYCWMELKKRNKRIILESSRSKKSSNGPPSIQNRSHRSSHSNYNPISKPNSTRSNKIPHFYNNFPIQDQIQNVKKPVFGLLKQPTNPNRQRMSQYQGQNQNQNDEQVILDHEFEEIVIERLSMIEQNINLLMRAKNIKQRKSQISTPLQSYLEQRPIVFQQHDKQLAKNFKYTPIIPNFKSKLPYKHKNIHHQEQNLINNIGDFEISSLPRENEVYLQKENASHQQKQRQSYLNRLYECKTVRNKVHYPPQNIQMLTVIQPRGKFFSRNRKGGNIKLEDQFREKSISNISKKSELSRRNNLSSFC